jgi:hypothetical protein
VIKLSRGKAQRMSSMQPCERQHRRPGAGSPRRAAGIRTALRLRRYVTHDGRRGELQLFEKLFLEVGVGGFPVRRTAAAALSERHHCARSATNRANSPAARTRQHVTASPVVPAHKVGLDGVLSEQHRHWILDMSGRYVPVDVHALQSLNQSCFECLDHHVFQLIPPGRLCKA